MAPNLVKSHHVGTPILHQHPARLRNCLAQETSPYLLQHKHNPVDWWPWGAEALAEAKRTNKPILLSVGYAACHWCHVMAHESFEDEATARLMNELFVNIKVDREERPDIDQIYMGAASLGRAGRLAADHVPHAGRRAGLGRHLFSQDLALWPAGLCRRAARGRAAVREEPDKIGNNRDALMERLSAQARPAGRVVIGTRELDQLARQVAGAIDPVHGGLRGAPKFPMPRSTSCCGGRGCVTATTGSST
jgi:uncharacterized protein YyaL (SSP411 family)